MQLFGKNLLIHSIFKLRSCNILGYTIPGFLNQWAVENFAVGHRAIQKIGCLVQKSLISFISIGELTKIGDSDALTFFSAIKAKITLPEVNIFFF